MKRITLITVAAALVMLLAACEPYAEAQYTVVNASDSIAGIRLQMKSRQTGAHVSIHKRDTTVWSPDLQEEIVLLPNEYVVMYYRWEDDSHVPSHTPLWENIVAVRLGSRSLPPEVWNSKGLWHSDNKDGGNWEEWSYILMLEE